MDYYVIPEVMYIFFLFCAATVIVSAIYVIVDQIRSHVRKKKEEKEFFAPVECKDEDELIRMQALYPGKYTARELLLISASLNTMLDECQFKATSGLAKLYDCFETVLTEEQSCVIDDHFCELEGICGFISFMRDQGIDAYLKYLQNGEIFFEDKPEHTEGGDLQ